MASVLEGCITNGRIELEPLRTRDLVQYGQLLLNNLSPAKVNHKVRVRSGIRIRNPELILWTPESKTCYLIWDDRVCTKVISIRQLTV